MTVLLTLLAILLAILVTIIFFFVRTNQPMAQAKKEATAIAKTSAYLETVDKF
ncbi:peptidase, partial [Enterococcus faecalis]